MKKQIFGDPIHPLLTPQCCIHLGGFINKRTNYHLTDGAIPVLQTSYHPATVNTVLASVQLQLGKGNSQFAEQDPLLSESYSTTSDTAFTGVNNCQKILIRLLPFPRTLVSDEEAIETVSGRI